MQDFTHAAVELEKKKQGNWVHQKTKETNLEILIYLK